MGAGLSDEEDGGRERTPCNERYLHWLLSDPTRVQEAFKPVWRACSTDEQGTTQKAAVLEVMLRVVAEFERGAETGGRAAASNKTPRQLTRVVGMFPEKLTRTEALHLFKTALLSVQASLVTTLGQRVLPDWPQPTTFAAVQPGDSAGGALPSNGGEAARRHRPSSERRRQQGSAAQEAPGADAPSNRSRYGAAGLPLSGFGALGVASVGAVEMVPSSRASTRAEDTTPALRVMRLHPAVKAARLAPPGVLPSREELDVENALLSDLSEVVEASARDELAVVRSLEEEVRASEANGEPRRRNRGLGAERGGDDPLFLALEAKAQATQEEVAQLETTAKDRDRELTECESEVAGQQREIQMLLAKRGQEEASADEFSREARDLTLELKSCRRNCGSLESEIASEEARAAALRQAFEGRRARFTTAETAARNAELSTMRATRRRIAAEAAARREASAVEEAENARHLMASSSALKVEALTSQLEEMRKRARSQSVASGVGRRFSSTTRGGTEAEGALATLRAELQLAESERDSEVAAAQSSAGEVAELEVARARLEGQLVGRESELQAMHRRTLRSEADGPQSAEHNDQGEVGRMVAILQAVESRAAAAKKRELEMCSELQDLAAARGCGAVPDRLADTQEELAVDAAWRRAREVGAELGEANAALARRRAQDQSSGGGDVVVTLRVALQDAEQREAQRCAELAEACDRLTASLAEQSSLRQRASRLVEATTQGSTAVFPPAARQLGTSAHVNAAESKGIVLEEERLFRSRALVAAEAKVVEARVQATVQQISPTALGRRNAVGLGSLSGGTAEGADPGPVLQQVQHKLESKLGHRDGLTERMKLDSLSMLHGGLASGGGAVGGGLLRGAR